MADIYNGHCPIPWSWAVWSRARRQVCVVQAVCNGMQRRGHSRRSSKGQERSELSQLEAWNRPKGNTRMQHEDLVANNATPRRQPRQARALHACITVCAPPDYHCAWPRQDKDCRPAGVAGKQHRWIRSKGAGEQGNRGIGARDIRRHDAIRRRVWELGFGT